MSIRSSVVVALVLVATACGPSLESYEHVGEKGVLAFSLFNCIKCSPTAVRVGSGKVVLGAWRLQSGFPVGKKQMLRGEFDLLSEDEAILSPSVDLASDPPRLLMKPLSEGTTRLTVIDATGKVVDSTKVSAFKATRLALYSDTVTRAALTEQRVAAGSELNVFVRADGPTGELVTGEGWTWWIDDASIATIWDPGAALLLPDATTARLPDSFNFIYLRGKKPGTTTLHVTDGNAQTSVPVVVP